jgi:formate dehydrogenase major subunit
MGRNVQTEHLESTCSRCSIGCGMKIVTRGGNVLRIDSDWASPVNRGLLCKRGRFEPLYDERPRITAPLLKRKGTAVPASWDEALQAVSDQIGGVKAKDLGVLASTHATNEALYLVDSLFRQELKAGNVGILNDATPKLFGKVPGRLADIDGSDLILVVGADPLTDQPVASYPLKRAMDRGVRIVVVDFKENGLAPFASMSLGMTEIKKAVAIAERAEHPAVLYGSSVTETVADALKKLAKKASFIPIEPGVNTHAAVAFGLNNGFKPSATKVLYVLLGEQDWDCEEVLKKIPKNAFVVAQASFRNTLTDRADVVLPMAIWSERGGNLTNTEGRLRKLNKAVEPQGEAKPDWEALSLLAGKLGKKLGASLKELSGRANKQFKP